MKKLYIPLITLVVLSISIQAQEKSKKERKGDKYAFIYAYDKAIDSYTHATQLTVEGQRRLAESYHNIGQNVQSEEAYLKLTSNTTDVLPEDYYSYAMILKMNGKYDESNKWMDKFYTAKPADLRATDYRATKAQFPDLLKDNGRYTIRHLDINTSVQDFGTAYYKNKIVFASTRAMPKWIKRKDNWGGKPFLDMYISEVSDGQLKTPENFSKQLNTKMHDGPVSFSGDGTFIAFTRNNSHDKSKDKIVELQIYFSNYKDEKWSGPVPFNFNNKEFSVGHPCLTANGNTMYFTSDMPGGYGGSDIYKTSKDATGAWMQPENMGNKINTEGDELFPFFEEKNTTLFFASNGRFGLGGLDIFICEMNGTVVSKVYNAGFPLNTQYDDFAAIIDGATNKGYISSNRAGGSGDDDIYSFDLLQIKEADKKIVGIAKDKNAQPIMGTFVTFLDDKGNVVDTITTQRDGAYTFIAPKNKYFRVLGSKQKYTDGDTLINTLGKELIITADIILLTKPETVAQKIEVGKDLGKILAVDQVVMNQPIYFDLNKYTIRPDAEFELDKIIKIMNEYPNMVVELGSHSDCRGNKEYNQVLSDKRAKASAWYIQKKITTPDRISGKGYGEEKLVNTCSCEGAIVSDCLEDSHQKNRRTEFIIVKK